MPLAARLPRSPLSFFLSPSLPRSPDVLQLLVTVFPSQTVLVRQLGLWTAGEVDGGFVLLVAVNVLEVYHHVQGVRQHQEQDQRRHQAHQDGGREEGGTVTG